jgi:hypothetical protein
MAASEQTSAAAKGSAWNAAATGCVEHWGRFPAALATVLIAEAGVTPSARSEEGREPWQRASRALFPMGAAVLPIRCRE